jgi:hypothetical protein
MPLKAVTDRRLTANFAAVDPDHRTIGGEQRAAAAHCDTAPTHTRNRRRIPTVIVFMCISLKKNKFR